VLQLGKTQSNNDMCAKGLHFSTGSIKVCDVMGANTPPTTMSEILDRLDVIREELFSLQRSLQKLATAEAVARGSKDGVPAGSDVGP
jgi:hypothetical protein